MFLLLPIRESEGGELFFTYPTAPFYLGAVRVGTFLLLYLALCGGTILAVCAILGLPPGGLLLQTFLQSLFFSAFGFAAIVLMGNSDLSLAVVLLYAVPFRLGVGSLPDWLNIYVGDRGLPANQTTLLSLLRKSFLLSGMLWLCAQLRLRSLRTH